MSGEGVRVVIMVLYVVGDAIDGMVLDVDEMWFAKWR
jgi:hypothetical protein